MADDFPDFHHKVCKRLAHLQAGFFQLNIKNDENDLIYQTLIDTYEQEMDNVVRGANEIVDKYVNDNPQFKEVHEIHEAYKLFKQTFEKERTNAAAEYDKYKENVEARVQEINQEAQNQVLLYKTEMDELREKLDHMQNLVEKNLGKNLQAEIEEKRAKEAEEKRVKAEMEDKDKELSDIKVRYLQLEREFHELDEAYKAEEWEVDDLKNKIVDNEKLILALRNALAQDHVLENRDNIASIEFEGASNSHEDISGLSTQVKDLQKELQEAKSESLRVLKEKEDEKMEEYENRLREASREHNKMIEALHQEYNNNLEEMESDFEKERKKWESMVQGMQTTLESRAEYITGLEEKLKSLEAFIENAKVENQKREDSLREEIQRLNTVYEDTRKLYDDKIEAEREKAAKAEEDRTIALEEAKTESATNLRALRDELNQAKHEAENQKETRIKELEAQVESLMNGPAPAHLAEEYQNKVNELSLRHNNYIRELMEKNEEKTNQLEKKHEKDIEEMKKELERQKETIMRTKDEDKSSELGKLKKDYESKIQKISKGFDQQLKDKINDFEDRLKGKDTEVTNLRKEIDIVKLQLKVEVQKLKDKETSYKELEKAVSDKNSPLIAVTEETARSTDGGTTLRGDLNKLKGSYFDKDKDEIIKDHIKYAQRMNDMMSNLRHQHEAKIGILEDKYSELMRAFEDRPSRPEDLDLIRQLQEEDERKKSNMNNDSVKFTTIKHNITYQKISNSQPHLGAANNTTSHSVEKARRPQKAMSPMHAQTVLPPIAISQFNIQMRSPPTVNGLLASKKFFK